MSESELRTIIAKQQQRIQALEDSERKYREELFRIRTGATSADGKEPARDEIDPEREQESARQAEQLRLIYTGAQLGSWVWDFSDDGVETFGTTLEIWGRTDLRRAQQFIEIIHPEDRDRVIRQVEMAMNDPAMKYAPEFRVVWPDGSIHWIYGPGTIFRDDEGRPVRMVGVNWDVTDRKEAEFALLESRTRLALSLEAGRAGTFEWDIVNNINRWSPEVERLYGLEPGSFGGTREDWEVLVYPEDLPIAIGYLERSLKTGELGGGWRVLHKDGSVHWLRARGIVEFDAQGQPVRMLGINVDVTDLKEAEIALEASNHELQLTAERVQLALAAGAIVGTWVWDVPNDRFTVDEGFAFFFGLSPERASAGLSINEMILTVHPDDIAELRDAVNEAMARGGPYSHEYRVRGLDGQYRWVEANGRVELAEDGTPLRFPGVLRDISDRREVQRALRESEVRYRLFVENAPAAIAMFDKDMRYVAASRRWLLDFHLGPDIVAQSHYDLMPNMPVHWSSLHQRALAGEVISMDREAFVVSGGRTQWIKWDIHPWRDADGEIGGILISSEDVTGAVQAERAIRESEKLAVVGRLAAVISHEINNPLEAVFNLIYLSRNAETLDQSSAFLIQAEEELKRVSHIVTHTLVFNRESKEHTLEKVSSIIESSLAIYAGRLKQSDIQVLRRYREQQRVRCMTSELRQVFANLIGNSFDAMRRGGKLEVRTHDCAHPQTGKAGVAISIADTGCGMDANTLSRMFEPFFTTKAHGTGLGLWVSSDIIRRHEGEMRVRSKKEKGSVFLMWLPVGDQVMSGRHDSAT